MHLVCDGRGRPPAFLVTGGDRNDRTRAEAVISRIHVPRPGPGRPRTRPDHVVADKGYPARTFRPYLRRRGIKAKTPERADQRAARRRQRERPRGFDKAAHRRRNTVQRRFHHLKQWHAIATRYVQTPRPLPRHHHPRQHTHLPRPMIDKTPPRTCPRRPAPGDLAPNHVGAHHRRHTTHRI
ncbi:transposase [Streptomyces sp. NPDC006638]|uniref:transposase n=1 Tax=Streptomyces sp. NPDC006638 TaxID=3157183 RepID=UPI0033B55393